MRTSNVDGTHETLVTGDEARLLNAIVNAKLDHNHGIGHWALSHTMEYRLVAIIDMMASMHGTTRERIAEIFEDYGAY